MEKIENFNNKESQPNEKFLSQEKEETIEDNIDLTEQAVEKLLERRYFNEVADITLELAKLGKNTK